ncbi:MAG: response regulator [Flavobacteriales bacterium]
MQNTMLPRAMRQETEASETSSASARKKRVLVVDDELDTAIILSLLLKRMGYEVLTAYDGVDGMNWVDRVHPDAILLDLGMPDMDGFEVCRTIRAMPWGGSVKMIAVTGRGEPEDKLQSMEAGFDLHLVKPVNQWTLAEALGPSEGF